ncbi:hypothetical protein RND71_027499 [Anisodus tanguticus]|uniref:Erythronate-4-phosphate dehydrogenase family protein n=1 Tax=Anisodus tanguticus TaxID=243964 RepID=A0AAE1RJ09_9SOLA|nr:hypothetical protein RND71_027499 [Anisodus tanguticus]
MENSRDFLSNGKPADPGLQIIRHPSYQSCGKLSLSWFYIRVFYIRISNYMVEDSTPEILTLNHIPLSPDTLLDVNGKRCSMYLEGASCLLRRDRVDKTAEEATFVSTDSIRLSGNVNFEVLHKDELVLSGTLEMADINGFTGESKNCLRRWSMNCESVLIAGTGFLKGKHVVGSESLSPTIEVYVAGCFCGTPIILTKTLQLNHRKKHHRKGMLDSIPEHETVEQHKKVSSEYDLQVTEYRNYKPESEEDYNMYWRGMELMDGEDGMSWFNAGVRVGVGIGLGVCVGVGLLVRTTRNLRRRLM